MGCFGRLAQLGEHQLDKLGVTGSSPVPPIKKPAGNSGFLRSMRASRHQFRVGWKESSSGFPAALISAAPDVHRPARRDARGHGDLYAVKWREPAGQTFLGRLVFTPQALVLEGRNGDEHGVTRTIGFDEVRGFRVGRAGDERLDGQPTL